VGVYWISFRERGQTVVDDGRAAGLAAEGAGLSRGADRQSDKVIRREGGHDGRRGPGGGPVGRLDGGPNRGPTLSSPPSAKHDRPSGSSAADVAFVARRLQSTSASSSLRFIVARRATSLSKRETTVSLALCSIARLNLPRQPSAPVGFSGGSFRRGGCCQQLRRFLRPRVRCAVLCF